jgi:Tfp pilus assembly PilM family ATPase
MFKKPRTLGVSFLQGRIQMAEVEHGNTVQLTALLEGETTTDFTQAASQLSPAHPQLDVFVNEIRALLKRQRLMPGQISFALPANPLFINLIPVDPTLAGPSLKTHLNWELSQYYPEGDPRDFILGSSIIPSPDGGPSQAFMVGLPRGLVGFVQKAAAALKMKMLLVDVDQFSVEKTVIHEGRMTDYRVYAMDPSTDPTWAIYAYLHYLQDRGIPEPAAIILHGAEVQKDMIATIRTETGIKQTVALNAVRKLPVMKGVHAAFLKESHRFGAAIGLALRTQ